MDRNNQLSAWRRWVQQPQNLWVRRALFQVHLWSGVGIGLYVLMISMTGSVLVYANELYRAATPKPIFSTATGPRLSDEQLKDAAMRAYPGYRVVNLGRARNLDQAVDVSLRRGGQEKSASSIRGRAMTSANPCRCVFGWCRSCSICTTTCLPGPPAGR